MDKILFVDRDGTLIREPEDEQIDSLEKLEFLPGVFRNLYFIRHLLDYRLVMVSNQDGLGSERYPRDTFNKIQDKILRAFKNEGITFDEVLIDESTPANPSPGRKPGTGMVRTYLDKNDWDRVKSFVIGDRVSDIELAKNMGIRGILMSNQQVPAGLSKKTVLKNATWDEIFHFLQNVDKSAVIQRKTSETDIKGELYLYGSGQTSVNTGLKFFDHMLEQWPRHGGFDLELSIKGDLEVDEHHTMEDTGIALGEAFANAISNAKGLQRYGFVLPMDESRAEVALDFGGRAELVWEAEFSREKIGDVPTEMFRHFFKSFAHAAKCNLHIVCKGDNEHHKIEAIFKGVARAIKSAVRQDLLDVSLPTTKGML
ncbi:MAG: bifunctional histidinol-phosphatase/imidazoleglycerol-phosphate dehydratase HisB [Bacteroidales bacterium]|nr:bifunctional histidinol-phosphatase/imidazoleglycerol-phosphate dehydratase HisB [Bacteroidales bacterium]MCF8333658.1 bifunctional histidinol-phosphatase/imidazoleglycerol-phosphate dehydratase HisB [Bacteroidales bacterium]